MKYKIYFRKPKKTKILVYYSYEENDIYLKKILKNNFYIYKGKYELNLFTLFFTIFKNGIFNIKKNYFINQIKFLNPKIAVTLNDLNKKFYEIKNIDKKIKLISIQSSQRFEPQYYPLKNSKADFYLSCGKYFSNLASKYINAKFIEIGSFRNNFFKSNLSKKKSLVFISVFKLNHKKISPGEVRILRYLERFCLKYNFKLNIFGRLKYNSNLKKKYKSIISKVECKFIDNNKVFHSFYNLYKDFDIFIFERSTSAYETTALGKKTLVFNFYNTDKAWYSKHGMTENFPMDKSKAEGPFWSHDCSYEEFENKMFKVINMNIKSWKKISNSIIKNTMIYDYKNKKLKKILSNLLI